MLIHREPNLVIFFGGKLQQFAPQQFYDLTERELMQQAQFKDIMATGHVQRLMALKQVHGIAGAVCECDSVLEPYSLEGDYLMTSSPRVGLGVATADCLPVILFDKKKRSLAVIHAGWRGSVAGIVDRALEHMQQEYGTQFEDITIFLGPCARACCYEVQENFSTELEVADRHALVKRAGKIYFDLVAFHKKRLIDKGMAPDSIQEQYAVCTMCTKTFCSYRRDEKNSGRQMTIACLI
jgi:YfiH family protein